jgi:hypothetical protein
MKWNFNDPTNQKDDQMPLIQAERKAVYKECAIMAVILAVWITVIIIALC